MITNRYSHVNIFSHIYPFNFLLYSVRANEHQNMKTISEIRLDNLRAAIGRAQGAAKLADKAGITAAYISHITTGVVDAKTGKVKGLGDKAARKIEQALDAPRGWMDVEHSQDTSESLSTNARLISTYSFLDELPKDTVVLVRSIELEFCNGHGRDGVENWDIVKKEPLPFQTDYIKRLNAKPADLVAAKVVGRSMEPRLFHGDTVLIDEKDTRVPGNGGVFAIVCGCELMIKRLFMLPDGIRVQSDNAAEGPTFELIGERANAVKIIGRVKYRSGAGDF